MGGAAPRGSVRSISAKRPPVASPSNRMRTSTPRNHSGSALSTTRGGTRGSVLIEPSPRLLSEMAAVDQVEYPMRHVRPDFLADRSRHVQPDEIQERQRSHRAAGSQLNAGVDRARVQSQA